jgi:hypothetical protein
LRFSPSYSSIRASKTEAAIQTRSRNYGGSDGKQFLFPFFITPHGKSLRHTRAAFLVQHQKAEQTEVYWKEKGGTT